LSHPDSQTLVQADLIGELEGAGGAPDAGECGPAFKVLRALALRLLADATERCSACGPGAPAARLWLTRGYSLPDIKMQQEKDIYFCRVPAVRAAPARQRERALQHARLRPQC